MNTVPQVRRWPLSRTRAAATALASTFPVLLISSSTVQPCHETCRSGLLRDDCKVRSPDIRALPTRQTVQQTWAALARLPPVMARIRGLPLRVIRKSQLLLGSASARRGGIPRAEDAQGLSLNRCFGPTS